MTTSGVDYDRIWRVRSSRWFPYLKALKIHRWRLYSIHLCVGSPPNGKPDRFRMTEELQTIPWDGYTPILLAYRFGPGGNDIAMVPDPRSLPSVQPLITALISRFTREIVRGQPPLDPMRPRLPKVE